MLLNDIKWSEELSAHEVLRRGIPQLVMVAEGIYGDTPGNTLAAGQLLYLRRRGRLLENLGWVQSIPPDLELTRNQLQRWDLCFLGHALQTSSEGSEEIIDKAVTVVRFDFDLQVCEKVGDKDPESLKYRLESLLHGVAYDAIGSDTDQTHHEYINLQSGEGVAAIYEVGPSGLRDTDNKPSLPSKQPTNPTIRSFSTGDKPDQSTRKNLVTPPPRPPKSPLVCSMSLSHTGENSGGALSMKSRPLPKVATSNVDSHGSLPSPNKPAASRHHSSGEPVSPSLLPVKETELDEDDDGYEKIPDWQLDECRMSKKRAAESKKKIGILSSVFMSGSPANCGSKPSAAVKPRQSKTTEDMPVVPDKFKKLSSKGLLDVLQKLRIDEASVTVFKDKRINGGFLSALAGESGFRMLENDFKMSVIDIHLLQKHIFDGLAPDPDTDSD